MAAPYTTYDVGSSSSLADDVQDKIYQIDPTETPFASSIKSLKASQPLHEWLTDALAAPAANAKIEGSDATYGDETAATRLSNRCQILRKTVQVSETLQTSVNYGIKEMAAYKLAQKAAELKRDVEYAMIGAGRQNVVTGNDTTTAAQMKCAQRQIDASTTDANGGTPRALAEADFLSVMQACYEAGGDPGTFLIAPKHATVVAGWATAGTGVSRALNDGVTTLTNAVDIIRTPFGTVDVVIDRFLDPACALVLDTKYWAKAILRPMKETKLAKTGSSEKWMLETELTLACLAPKASGLIDDLS